MKFEGTPKQSAKVENKQPKSEAKKSTELYSVTETDDGGFEVVMPGLFNKEKGFILSTSYSRFESRAEAVATIEVSKEKSRIMFERASLEKSFTDNFYRIDETEGGRFKVTLPGLRHSETGHYVGTTTKEFNLWDEAKYFYLQSLEDKSQLTEHPILEIKTGEAEQVSFSDFENFNPKVSPAESPRHISPAVEKYILQKEKLAGEAISASTYQETIKDEGWQRKIYSFVSTWLAEEGKEAAADLRVENLDLLTPRQAVDLTTRLVVELSKYKWSDVKGGSKADQSTTLDLLKEGLANKDNDEWEGNGVCRNFASMTKAVFEALKANQTKFSRLRNTYCLYDNGMDEFAPKRENKNVEDVGRAGHTWNTFVTISKNEANATIIDTTWAKRNLDTGEVEGLDYTLTRMEPIIHQIATELSTDAPDKEAQLNHIFSYYQLKMEVPSRTLVPVDELDAEQKDHYKRIAEKNLAGRYDLSQLSENQIIQAGQQLIIFSETEEQKEENQFFISRVLDIIKTQEELPPIPDSLLKVLGEEYQVLAEDSDFTEIETLWRISKQHEDFPFSDILKNYLKDKRLTEYHSQELIFADDGLQRLVFEKIKTHPKFEEFMETSPSFRTRMREVLPELLPNFSPGTNEADAEELKHLIDRSRFRYLFIPPQLNEESVTNFFIKTRETLRNINPEIYKQIADGLDDYELMKRYDALRLRLSGK